MLRHATFKVTADIYTQAITDTKRDAHNKVVKQLIAEPGKDGECFGILASPTGFEPVLPP